MFSFVVKFGFLQTRMQERVLGKGTWQEKAAKCYETERLGKAEQPINEVRTT